MSLDIEFALRDAKLDKYVTVEDAVVDGVEYVVIRPNGYLGNKIFGKVARELEQFQVEYLSLGKNSHWRTKKETIMRMQPQEPKAVSIETMMPPKDARALEQKEDGRSKQTTQPQKLTTTLQINEEYLKLLPKLPNEEYEALKNSIRIEGQHFPIIVNEDKVILDGHHRYQVCLELNQEPKYKEKNFENKLSEKKFVIESNLLRRQLTTLQRIEMALPLYEVEKELAKERMLIGDPTKKFSEGEARNIVAKKIGISGVTFDKGKKIIEQAPEDVKQRVRNGNQSINYAYQQIIREEKHENPPDLPQGQFDIIYADPPWKYDFAETDGNADIHYKAMDTSEISALPIPSAKDAILFLWATNPKLQDAIRVMKAWGFEYITNLVWVKGKGGIGYYFQGDHELLLLGKKGNIPIPMPKDRPSSVLQVAKTNHSSKPTEIYDIIEKMYPNRTYLELFARKKREGWQSWGDEILSN